MTQKTDVVNPRSVITWFANLKLKSKLIVSFVTVISLFAIFLIFVNFNLFRINSETRNLSREAVPQMQIASTIKSDWFDVRYNIIQYINTANLKFYRKGEGYIDSTLKVIDFAYRTDSLVSAKHEIVPALDSIKLDINNYKRVLEQIYSVLQFTANNANADAGMLVKQAEYTDSLKLISQQIDARAQSIALVSFVKIDNLSVSASRKVLSGIVFGIIVGLLIIGISVLITLYIPSALATAIQNNVLLAESIAEGKLSVRDNLEQRTDELGQLEFSMNRMAGKLRTIVTTINDGAETFEYTSKHLNKVSHRTSSQSTQQASAIEEIAASMEEMTSIIEQTARNAGQTEKIASRATSDLRETQQTVKASKDAIQDISNKIVIVNEIAFQTNLLALNAAVEAARAGEHGRGFAVVAAEVRKLAERSRVAANEINQISAVCLKTSNQAHTKLTHVVSEIENTLTLVSEIAGSCVEQQLGAAQVNSAIQQLNESTLTYTSSSEELANSADQLLVQARTIKDTLDYFVI